MNKVKEMYVTYATISGSKYVLTIMEDDSLSLTWYHGASRVQEINPKIVKKGTESSTYVEYGASNLFGTRPSMPFLKCNGEVEDRWEKIK